MMGDPVLAWCYGHTHQSHNTIISKTRVVSNQLGYEYSFGEADHEFYTEYYLDIDSSGNVWTIAGDSRKRTVYLERKKAKEAITQHLAAPPPPPPPPPAAPGKASN
eukprot:TRINITY_DN7615_c0_g1_i2.p1 TRINITY_DN7615_c0_g1~~TRINITY_DN7615_c0_g1_i2.p1  ORF type:complete len:106 (-),score=29.34 TRINITY_DN7615_c0_g1_i2:40-357(-)